MAFPSVRRRTAALVAMLVATAGLAIATPGPAQALPRPLAAPGDSGDDGEGGSKELIEKVESASKAFVEAKEKLAASKKRQQDLTKRLKEIDVELGPRQAALDEVVQQTYRTGRLNTMGVLLTAGSASNLMERVGTLETMAVQQQRAVSELTDSKTEQQQAKTAVETEIRNQQRQVNVMAKGKTEAENALKTFRAEAAADQEQSSGASSSGSSSGGGNSSSAAAAPRNSDGSLGGGSCSVDDPTTTGCITPLTLHAMQQAQSDGFTRFVSCFRPQGSGEHPKGRACDFASDKNGFGGVATGSSRTYGDNLANYFIDNADRLGVLYVIWFKRIWLPSSGWEAYSGGGGDPSSDHTNHVHLSMR